MNTRLVSTHGFGVAEASETVYELESLLKGLPQIEIQVSHKFADGLYYREILIPKGSAMTGRVHKFSDMNVVFYGDMDILMEDGTMKRVVGPASFPGKAGVKQFGVANEDTLWATVHRTDLTDLEEIESALFEDEDSMFNFKTGEVTPEALARVDYSRVLKEFEISHEQARMETEFTEDLCWIDLDALGLEVANSQIQGFGLFAKRAFLPGEAICPATVDGKRTQAGRSTNHSPSPNAIPELDSADDIHFVASEHIAEGQEILTDYRRTLALRGRSVNQEVAPCLQQLPLQQ